MHNKNLHALSHGRPLPGHTCCCSLVRLRMLDCVPVAVVSPLQKLAMEEVSSSCTISGHPSDSRRAVKSSMPDQSWAVDGT